jgi:hypothetical protein
MKALQHLFGGATAQRLVRLAVNPFGGPLKCVLFSICSDVAGQSAGSTLFMNHRERLCAGARGGLVNRERRLVHVVRGRPYANEYRVLAIAVRFCIKHVSSSKCAQES